MKRIVLLMSTMFVGLLAGAPVTAQEFGDPDWVERAVSETLTFFEPDSVLIIGELHGTEEAPVLVRALAQSLAADTSVVVGLEMSRQEQQRLDEFLASDGSESAAAALLEGEFWQGRDGRSSEGIFRLVDELRVARNAGARIDIVTLDDETFFDASVDRRQGMARRIEELAENDAYDIAVVLVGNFHARLALPDRVISDGVVLADPPVPMAARITAVPVTTANVSACSGSHWACPSRDSCGPVQVMAQCEVDEFPVVEEFDPARFGYHLSITLEAFTPSSPMR